MSGKDFEPMVIGFNKKISQIVFYKTTSNGGVHHSSGFGFQSLIPFFYRYADVIGPRDSTRRFAFYHTWLKFYDDIGIPFHIPNKVENVSCNSLFVALEHLSKFSCD